MAISPISLDTTGSSGAAGSAARTAPRRSRQAARDRWFAFWLVLPTIIVVLGVSVYPVGRAIWTSFHNYNPAIGLNQWIGLENYRFILSEPGTLFYDSLWVTLRFALASTILTIAIGLGMALVLNQSFVGRGLMRSVILVPWAMSGTVVGVLWAWMYDGGYGAINGVLYKFGFIDKYIAFLSNVELPILGRATLYFVVIAFVWNAAPMAALFFLAALQSVPRNLYSAARMDGASTWQRFRHITFPSIKPMFALVLLLSTINGVMAFDLIYFLTKGGPGFETTVFSWLGYNTIFGFFQFGQGTAILLLLTVLVLALAFVYMNLLGRQPSDRAARQLAEATVEDLEEDLQRRSVRYARQLVELTKESGRAFNPPAPGFWNSPRGRALRGRLIYAPAALILFWSLAPVVWLFICSVSPFTDLLTKPPVFWPDFTLDNYRAIVTGKSAADTAGVPLVAQRVPDALRNSAIISGTTALVCLVIGSLSGYAFSRLGHVKFLGPTMILMMMMRMVPALAIMVPWFIQFRNWGLANTKQGLIISYASFSIPLVLWIMKTYFDTVPRSLERAAAVDGCNRLQTLYRVVLPLSVPGLIAAGLFTFIASWNEFIFALNLAQDPDSMTITYVIAQVFSVVAYGPQNYGTLFASGIVAILPPVILAFVFQRFLVQGLTAGSVKG